MANITITNNDPRPVAIGPVDGVEALVAFAGADTFVKGTILGRRTTSATTYAGTPTGTGDRVTALTALAGRSMKPGTYTITYGDVTAGAGPITMVDPDGISESITATASGDQEFPLLGVNVNIAASGTAYDDGDTIAFTVVAATGKELYAPFSPTGSNGLQNPSAVLADDLTATGSGNVAARPIVRGDVNLALLVIDEDGDGDNITLAHIEQMRVNGLFPKSTTELGVIDNPQS